MAEKSENKVAERKRGSGYGWRTFCLILFLGWFGALFPFHPGWMFWGCFLFPPLAFFALFKLAILKNNFGLAVLKVGELRTFEMRWLGHKFQGHSGNQNQAVETAKKEDQDAQWDVIVDPKGKGHAFGGLIWIGLFFLNSVHKYRLSWKTISYAGEITTHEKEELDRFLLTKKAYYFDIEKVEDQNQMPLRINGQVILQMVNPKKALFNVDDYLTVVLNLIKAEIVRVVRQLQFYKRVESLSEGETGATTSIPIDKEKIISAIVEKVQDKEFVQRLLKAYGEELIAVTISNIDPEEDQDRQATLKPVRARLEAEATIEKAKGDAEKTQIEAKAKGEARKIQAQAESQATVEEFGGAHMKISEMLGNAIPPEKAAEIAERYVTLDKETEQGARKKLIFEGLEGGGGLVGTAAVIAELVKGFTGGPTPQNKTSSEGGESNQPQEKGGGKNSSPGSSNERGGSGGGSSSLNEQKKSGKDKPARKIKTIEEADAYFQQLEEGRTEEEEEEEEEV